MRYKARIGVVLLAGGMMAIPFAAEPTGDQGVATTASGASLDIKGSEVPSNQDEIPPDISSIRKAAERGNAEA